MKNPKKSALAAMAIAIGAVGATIAPAAADHGTPTYYEITPGSSSEAVGVVTAVALNAPSTDVEITISVDNLTVDAVEMHFHEGTSCDAMGGIAIAVPAPAAAGETSATQTIVDGKLRLTTTEPLGDTDLSNVYFNIHEADNLGNVVACGTVADTSTHVYNGQADSASSLTVTKKVVGSTVQTQVEASDLGVESVVMHFHEGATCDAMGGIVLGLNQNAPVASAGGTLDATFVDAKPAALTNPAAVYFNVHEAANLGNVVACGTLAGADGAGTVAEAETLEEIINASDYDTATDPEILRLYRAFFNRDADVGGGIYWIGQRDSFGALEIAQAFPGSSEEFQNTYASAPDSETFLTRVYDNMLDRTPDDDGFAYWLDILNGTNTSGENPTLTQGDRGAVVFYVAVNDEFINAFPFLP